jgi:hypothetical protein
MTNTTRFGLAIACYMAVMAFSPYSQPAVAVDLQKPVAEGAETPETTLTGCLKSHGADTAIAGPSGRLYTLEVAETVVSPAPTTSTPTGTPPSASVIRYSLDNVGKADLEKHADHQVQLTGRMQAPSKTAKENAATGAPSAAPPIPGGGHRTFHVTAVKMIAAKCS